MKPKNYPKKEVHFLNTTLVEKIGSGSRKPVADRTEPDPNQSFSNQYVFRLLGTNGRCCEKLSLSVPETQGYQISGVFIFLKNHLVSPEVIKSCSERQKKFRGFSLRKINDFG